MTTIAPYGSWKSPITTDLLTSKITHPSEPRLDGNNTYWLESRPQEKGRNTIVQLDAEGQIRDLLPAPLNVRSRVHEYGGMSYCVSNGIIYFVLFDDQQIYRFDTQAKTPLPEAITDAENVRFADLVLDSARNRLICVCEDHVADKKEPANKLVAISLDGSQQINTLHEGHDFYSNPQLSPDGRQLSWLTWDHPNMPWDNTCCWCAVLDAEGKPANPHCIAGEQGDESVFQPQWAGDGRLYLVSDRNNWWNLYCYDPQTDPDNPLRSVTRLEAEFATPQWVFGMSTYGFINESTALACYTQEGRWYLTLIDLQQGTLTPIETELTHLSGVHCTNGKAAFLGASPVELTRVWQWAATHSQTLTPLSKLALDNLDTHYLSTPEAITFPSANQSKAYGFYYAPANADFKAPADTRPPLVVMCHGGPTGATESSLNFKVQYWTSRGFAVLDVNYRGSTGYGREYRNQLALQWGIADVDDVCAGARYLVDQGLADPEQLAIKGGSAGGYTVLAALTFRDVFTAGASHYGIGDLETLARDTHKFESRYLDKMVGDYPQDQATYQARSPIQHTDQLSCPVIFFQGLDDKVVPPNQAEAMVAALKEKQIPVAYVPFEGEGHGFRQASSIKQALEGELYFYSRVFGFTPAEELMDVKIENL